MAPLRSSSKLSTFELVLASTTENSEFFEICRTLAKDAQNELNSATQVDSSSEEESTEVVLFHKSIYYFW